MPRPTERPGTRLERANTAFIRYPRFKELHQYIRQCQELSRMAGEPQCMSLEGVTGAGKSTLVQDYARAFPRALTTGGMQIPVLCMETPSPVTVKGMAAAMLAQLGDPAAYRGTLPPGRPRPGGGNARRPSARPSAPGKGHAGAALAGPAPAWPVLERRVAAVLFGPAGAVELLRAGHHPARTMSERSGAGPLGLAHAERHL